MSKRFRIAFSFSGDKREFVAQIASILARRCGADHVLYDKYHEAEDAGVSQFAGLGTARREKLEGAGGEGQQQLLLGGVTSQAQKAMGKNPTPQIGVKSPCTEAGKSVASESASNEARKVSSCSVIMW